LDCDQLQALILFASKPVTGYNPRLDLPALSKGLSAATQNHADQVGGLFYDERKSRARTHLWRPLDILILGNKVACFYTPGSGEHGPRFLTGGPGAAPGGVASKNGWVYMRVQVEFNFLYLFCVSATASSGINSAA